MSAHMTQQERIEFAQKNIKHLQRSLYRSRFLLKMSDAHIQKVLTLIKYWRKHI